MNITQEQSPVEVVANSVAQSGLDNSLIQPGEAGEPDQEEVRKPASEIGNPKWQNAEWDDCPGAAAAAELSTSRPAPRSAESQHRSQLGGRDLAVSNLSCRDIRGGGHLARQHPVLPANSEGEGHLARQHPALPATPRGTGILPVSNRSCQRLEGDGHLARQQPVLAGDVRGGRASCPSATSLPATSEGDGHLARQQPVLPATSEGDGHLARQQPALAGDFRGGRASCPSATCTCQRPRGTGILPVSNPHSAPNSEGDGHLARQQPVLGPTSEGDGHLARQHSVVPANANSPPGHQLTEPRPKIATTTRSRTCGRSRTRKPTLEHWPNPFGRTARAGHARAAPSRARAESKGRVPSTGPSCPRRPRFARTRKHSVSRRTLELPSNSPILASLPPADFSRVLADVHHEFEEEIEKPENNTRSLT